MTFFSCLDTGKYASERVSHSLRLSARDELCLVVHSQLLVPGRRLAS